MSEIRDHTIGITITGNQYDTIKYYTDNAPISTATADCAINHIENPDTPQFELISHSKKRHRHKYKYNVRLTKSQYNTFMAYYEKQSDESLASCIRNLIFREGGLGPRKWAGIDYQED